MQSKSLYKKFIENDPQIDELELKPPADVSSREEVANNETWISIAPDRFSDNVSITSNTFMLQRIIDIC